MAKSLTPEKAIRLIAKKYMAEDRFYQELPEFWAEHAERIVNKVESVLMRCTFLPRNHRPRRRG